MPVHDFSVKEGATVEKSFYWYSGTPVSVAISAITLTAPPVFTAAGHGLPTDSIPVQLQTIRGPRQLNTSPGERVHALKLTADTFSVPGTSAAGLSAYTGGGYLMYVPPKDLTGYTAVMHIRRTYGTAIAIEELTSAAGDIVITAAEGLTTVRFEAPYGIQDAVYDLELILASDDNHTTVLASGVITFERNAIHV